MTISIQGYLGSFHHIVAQKMFGKNIHLLERDTFREVFEDTITGRADYGLSAIENSLTGSLLENYDLLLEHQLHIVGEMYLRIAQQLIVLPGVKLQDIRTVHSHPVALRQCKKFLAAHPSWRIIEESDTAGSVKMIAEKKDRHAAAIAGALAAEVYDMHIAAHDIETNKHNYTRFLVLSRTSDSLQKTNKTSLCFATQDVPGALAKVLTEFAMAHLNLSKIESRPMIGKEWEYIFYVDIESGLQDAAMQKVLRRVAKHVHWIRILGSYARGKTVRKT